MMPPATATSAADEPETETEEASESQYDYGRLSGATVRKVKKTPVLLLDAVEASLATHEYEAEVERQISAGDDSHDPSIERPNLLAVHAHSAPEAESGTAPIVPEPALVDEPPAVETEERFEPEPAAEPEPAPSSEPMEHTALPVAGTQFEPEPEPEPEPALEAKASLAETLPEPEWHPEPEMVDAYDPAQPTRASSSVRALRARLAEPVEPEPTGFGALVKRVRAWLGL